MSHVLQYLPMFAGFSAGKKMSDIEIEETALSEMWRDGLPLTLRHAVLARAPALASYMTVERCRSLHGLGDAARVAAWVMTEEEQWGDAAVANAVVSLVLGRELLKRARRKTLSGQRYYQFCDFCYRIAPVGLKDRTLCDVHTSRPLSGKVGAQYLVAWRRSATFRAALRQLRLSLPAGVRREIDAGSAAWAARHFPLMASTYPGLDAADLVQTLDPLVATLHRHGGKRPVGWSLVEFLCRVEAELTACKVHRPGRPRKQR